MPIPGFSLAAQETASKLHITSLGKPMDITESHLSSAVHLHPSAEEEDHILQTALPTRPQQSFRELIHMLGRKATHNPLNVILLLQLFD